MSHFICNYFSRNKAQGAIEYLLILGGAILVAAIVLTFLGSFGQQKDEATRLQILNTQCENLSQSRCTDVVWANLDSDPEIECQWNAVLNKCEALSGSQIPVPEAAPPSVCTNLLQPDCEANAQCMWYGDSCIQRA